MANDLLTSEPISRLAVQLLTRSLVLMRTVSMVPGAEFGGPSGGTVHLRVPQPRNARTQTPGAPIVFDDIDEVSVPVSMAHLYNAGTLTDEDLNLTLENFGRQVLVPSVAAVATGAEARLATVMNALDVDVEVVADDAIAAVLEARVRLGEDDVPSAGRWLAVSPRFAQVLLDDPRLTNVDAAGSPSALREAVIGRMYGFTVVESNALTGGEAVAYHESAFGAAIRPPAAASGADTSTANHEGVGVRVVRDFNINNLSEAFAVSTFAGASVVTEDGTTGIDRRRAVKISIDAGSS